MNCPFCNNKLNILRESGPQTYNFTHCEELFNLNKVYIIYHNSKIYNKHIYFDKFHIRMNEDRYNTEVMMNNPILILPGFPFTPANVKEKLKTYLLFL